MDKNEILKELKEIAINKLHKTTNNYSVDRENVFIQILPSAMEKGIHYEITLNSKNASISLHLESDTENQAMISSIYKNCKEHIKENKLYKNYDGGIRKNKTIFKSISFIDTIDLLAPDLLSQIQSKLEIMINDFDQTILESLGEKNNIISKKEPVSKGENMLADLFLKAGLKLENEIIQSFYTGLKTKGFVLLAGLSGTGKTKIFEEFVKFFPANKNLFVPIRPDFKDSKSLLGYYNPLKEAYEKTPLLDFILNAQKNHKELKTQADPFFVLFDEMNLARVEYYFADFLSILESKRNENGLTSQSIKLHDHDGLDIPQELFLPPNLYFVGSVNIDETTHPFSPKVLDRAFTIEFDVDSFTEYTKFLKSVENKSPEIDEEVKQKIKDDFIDEGALANINKKKISLFIEQNQKYALKLEEINTILRPYQLHFGYRVFEEIMMFLYHCWKAGSLSEDKRVAFLNLDEAFDLAVKMKVLPKFNGTKKKLIPPIINILTQFIQFPITDEELKQPEKIPQSIEEFVKNGIPDLEALKKKKLGDKDNNYPHTAKKLLEMLYKLKTEGFAGFM